MSFKIPLKGDPIRELFDIQQLVEAGLPGGAAKLPTYQQIGPMGKATLAACMGSIEAVHYLFLDIDGWVALGQVRESGVYVLWVFGKPGL